MNRERMVLVFAALILTAPLAAAQSLTETKWVFTQIGDERLDASARARTSLALEAQSGRVAATAGCNRMAGGYTLNGDTISFTQMAMTRMACPPPLMQREEALAKALGAVRQWRIVEGNLLLADAGGATLLRLFAAGKP